MSESQRRGRKKNSAKEKLAKKKDTELAKSYKENLAEEVFAEEVPVKEEISLSDVFQEKEPEPEEVKRPDPLPKTAEKKATPKAPVVEVDPEKILRWLARIKVSGNFGQWFSGANFANHCVKECFTVDGKELTIEQASQLISPHMYVKAG